MKNIKKKYLVVICAVLLMCALFSTAVSAENKYTEQSGDTNVTGLTWSITPIESSTWEASLTLSGTTTSTPKMFTVLRGLMPLRSQMSTDFLSFILHQILLLR